jgi:hypothetical protein
MRRRGYLAEVVERWLPQARVRRDLLGFIDILCIVRDPVSEMFTDKPKVIGVQATSYSNIASRCRKIAEHENLEAVRAAGITILVQGWRRINGRWVYREVNVS